jgi:two-component system response regulator RegX3
VTKVLVVEDETSYSEALSYVLRKEGFDVAIAETGPDALTEFDRNGADIVLLDLMLPGLSGTEVCRALRQISSVPIIMVSAKDTEVDKVVGLELGADDYVTKPFSPRELAARVRTVLRRAPEPLQGPDRLEFGDVAVDTANREVTKGGAALRLTLKEFDLLCFLAANPNRVFSREQLMERVWGYEAAVDTGTLTVHVRRLREKVEDDPSRPQFLETVWGAGYRFRL